MKEYEYVVIGTDEFLVDELVSVICQENFEGASYPHGFRRIFDEFRYLHEEYQKKQTVLDNPEHEDEERKQYTKACITKRDVMFKKFCQDAIANSSDKNLEIKIQEYINKLEQADIVTLEQRVLIYPYIIKTIRESEATT